MVQEETPFMIPSHSGFENYLMESKIPYIMEAYRIARKRNYFFTGSSVDMAREAMQKGYAVILNGPLMDEVDPNCDLFKIGVFKKVLQAFAIRKVRDRQ